MKYIDKYAHSQEAHDINVDFLKDCYQGAGLPMYPRADSDQSFENFKNRDYRHGRDGHRGWEEVLMEEQDGHCCYCMRKVKSGKLNIEHMVPKTLKGERGLEEYARYAENAPAIKDFVDIAEVFARKSFAQKEEIESVKRMPHITAEANLLIACNGKREDSLDGCCCNNHRKDVYMLPIMLMEECDSRVDYDENGLMSILPEETSLKKIVEELNDDTFSTVRLIWYNISGTAHSLEQVKSMSKFIEKVVLLKTAFGVSNFELLSESVKTYAGSVDDSKQSFYWEFLLSYDWFFDFYRKRRNRTA